MYKRTFEILSKWVANAHNVTVEFDTDGTAHADMKAKILHLPKEIASENAYGALALLMHEAAHIKHSGVIPIHDIAKTKAEFSILNAIEDIRIDHKNFQLLPNIHDFYKEMVKKHIDLTSPQMEKSPLEVKAICYGILHLESFSPKASQDVKELASKIMPLLNAGQFNIENHQWKEVRNNVLEIKKILKIKVDQDMPLPKSYVSVKGEGMPGKDKSEGQDNGDPLDGIEGLLRPSSLWGKGDPMKGGSSNVIGTMAMDEMNAQTFKEALSIKEKKIIDGGSKLDTDQLTSYHTGDVDELFKEEKKIKVKKSKVFFLLDMSGSMGDRLMDREQKYKVVTKSVRKLTEILDEVNQVEGLNVDWDIGAFTTHYYELPKEGWDKQYFPTGGTNFQIPFIECLDKLKNDHTIDGRKIIIAMTDGDVHNDEIENIQRHIIENHTDVKSLIIGVGAMPTGALVQKIVGGNIILASLMAEEVIMEVIKELL